MTVPLTSVTKDVESLTLTVVGDYAVSQRRLWDAFADPRQLERFWGPPDWPATFTRHDLKVGGRAEYFLSGPNGERWNGSWRFTAVNPIRSFEAEDGDGDEEEGMPSSMTFTFDATPTGSRLTVVTRFSSVGAMERAIPGMEAGLRAAMPQLDVVLAEPSGAG
ncbi:SRPBCC domain-containing protein [Actinomadura barringtoniae]|uniref:SRPBCC domain-containing protein n=1 Tax=Actinomadura barringtoniae TaxID=1427535 RepID=A0A939P658_9ACTN|nr:SRPBCC domain-containing protein [Actinomadura barringtoniae]MBO2446015.1 SRPBCC domain-containing protein [Actinomadura barringtoniae]